MDQSQFLQVRERLLQGNGQVILEAEQRHMRLFQDVIHRNVEVLRRDFDLSSELYPFWANYPPEQRRRKPVGDSVP